MFSRLSVLPSFFMVFVVIFLSADFGIAKSSSLSPSIGSPTVPVSAYERGMPSGSSRGYNHGQSPAVPGRGLRRLSPLSSPYRPGPSLRRLTPSRPGSAASGIPGYSNSGHLNGALRYNGYDRYGQYLLPSGDLSSAYNTPSPNLNFLKAPLSGGIIDYRLPGTSIDQNQMDVEYRREKYRGVQSKEFNLLRHPAGERKENQEMLQAKNKMENEELLHDDKVHLKQDKSLSQQAKSDVNLAKKYQDDNKALKDDINESLNQPESLQVEKPLSMEEFHKRYAELKAAEKLKKTNEHQLQQGDTDESGDLPEKVDLAEALEDLKGKDLFNTKKQSDDTGKSSTGSNTRYDYKKFGKSAAKVEPVKNTDPMAGVTPENIDRKLKKSRELVKKAENFESHIKEKYLEYVNLADSYLAKGQYRNSIVAYNIAAAFSNDDPQAYAGNALAHMALRQYMSSSVYLVEALELPGDFASKKVDVAALIGDKKLYEKCLAELKSKYELAKYYKTAFLLAYLCYQDGDILNAKDCIDAAAEKMKQSHAWQSLSKAIDQALNKQKP